MSEGVRGRPESPHSQRVIYLKYKNNVVYYKFKAVNKMSDDAASAATNYDGLNMPFSAESEQAVLASVLLNSEECLPRAVELLPSGDYFYLSLNRMIYQAMVDMFAVGRPVDYFTVLEKLRSKSEFSENDTKVYLLQLMELVPGSENIGEYAKAVRDKYIARSLINAARQIIDDASGAYDDVADLVNSAEQRIYEISDDKVNKGLERVDSVIMQTLARLDLLNSPDSESYRGISTGIGLLDNTITGLNRSDLIILAARPGMGKTSFALNIAKYAATKCKKRVAFFSLEMGKEQLASRLLATEGCVSGTKLRSGKISNEEWTRLIEAADVLSKSEIYLDGTPGISVSDVRAKLRRLKNVDLVIIDYLQIMRSTKRTDSRVQEVSEMTRNLKILAKELDIPVMTLSQLSRDSEKRGKKEHRPQLSDLRDSGSIEQDADIVLFLYREDYYDEQSDKNPETSDKNSGECIVAKNRHGETRTVPLHWQGEFMRFTAEETDHAV